MVLPSPSEHRRAARVSSLSLSRLFTAYRPMRPCTSPQLRKSSLTARPMLTNDGISSASVADIRNRLLTAPSKPSALDISPAKPILRHLSNSSMTRYLMPPASMLPFSRWSTSRPGVANTTCGIILRSSRCSSMAGLPPYRHIDFNPHPMALNTSWDCRASSLPGTMTTARTSSDEASSMCTSGKR